MCNSIPVDAVAQDATALSMPSNGYYRKFLLLIQMTPYGGRAGFVLRSFPIGNRNLQTKIGFPPVNLAVTKGRNLIRSSPFCLFPFHTMKSEGCFSSLQVWGCVFQVANQIARCLWRIGRGSAYDREGREPAAVKSFVSVLVGTHGGSFERTPAKRPRDLE
jgi:hypothetical protein